MRRERRTLETECRKYLGLAPYNDPANIVFYDYYFINSVCKVYGDEAVAEMLAKLRKEASR